MKETQQSAALARAESTAEACDPEVADVVDRRSGWALTTQGSYVVSVTTGVFNADGARQMVDATERLCQKYAKVGSLSLLTESRSMLMSRDVRQELEKMVQRYTPYYAAAAVVFEGEGFAATVVRSVVTGINLTNKARHPARVFSKIEPALSWLEETFPEGTLPAELRACLKRLLMTLTQ